MRSLSFTVAKMNVTGVPEEVRGFMCLVII